MTSKLTNKHNKRKLYMKLIRSVLTYACETQMLSLGDGTNAICPIPYYTPKELPHISASTTTDLPASNVMSNQARSDSIQLPHFVSTALTHQNTDDNVHTKLHNKSTPSTFLSISHISLYLPPFAQIFFHRNFLRNDLRRGQEQWAR